MARAKRKSAKVRPREHAGGDLLDHVGRMDPGKLLGRPLTPEAKLVLLCLALGREPQTFFAVLRRYPEALQGTWSGTDENLVIGGMPM